MIYLNLDIFDLVLNVLKSVVTLDDFWDPDFRHLHSFHRRVRNTRFQSSPRAPAAPVWCRWVFDKTGCQKLKHDQHVRKRTWCINNYPNSACTYQWNSMSIWLYSIQYTLIISAFLMREFFMAAVSFRDRPPRGATFRTTEIPRVGARRWRSSCPWVHHQ